MVLTKDKRFKYFSAFCVIILISISKSECKGGRSGGGGGRSSSRGSSSHSSSHSSSSHSSSGSSYSYGTGSHSYGSGSSGHSAPSSHYSGSEHGYGSGSHSGGYNKPIGFDHVNQQSHNSLNGASNYHPGTVGRPGIGFDHINSQVSGRNTNQYHPYKPQSVVYPGGFVQYHPPTQLQYSPPPAVATVHHTSTHYVPVYQPTLVHTQASSYDHGSSFLGGYLVGRLSSGGHSQSHSTYVTNNYYDGNNDGGSGSSSYYRVHHYHHDRHRVPSNFTVDDDDLKECDSRTTDQLCVPNTSAFCLKNGTLMCTTPLVLTSPCEQNLTTRCVYSRIPCSANVACNVSSDKSYIDFYLPCVANLTYINYRVSDGNYEVHEVYNLCVTAIAHPRKLDSPFAAVVNFLSELGKWHLDQLVDIHNLTTPTNSTTT